MANSEAQDAAAKERIIRHMNADHQDSVRRYVEHFEKASFWQSRDARMTDVNLSEMKIAYSGKQAIIPFDPPMKSMREARERLVQLDQDAREALGRSDISITKFIPCYVHPGHLFNFTTCLLTYIAFSRSSNFRPGSFLFDNVLHMAPGFATFCSAIQPYLLPIMIAIHAFETALMSRKLKRHGLTPFDRLWWLWAGTCFVEGVTSAWRLEGHLQEKRKEKEGKKH